jgi:hypothetical protein
VYTITLVVSCTLFSLFLYIELSILLKYLSFCKEHRLEIPSTKEEGDTFIRFIERRQSVGRVTFTNAHQTGGYLKKLIQLLLLTYLI